MTVLKHIFFGIFNYKHFYFKVSYLFKPPKTKFYNEYEDHVSFLILTKSLGNR